eukprot:TRINITY_DN55423_c0_g1_i1.p1 TRINITY_DN55423_c0_g1~~TRINITY_DN55423_c0_g1_i1.p1  ORF type:complete len:129 (-),score=35.18 TRINITY_DN55423_c0_g1_i1:32-418(-)
MPPSAASDPEAVASAAKELAQEFEDTSAKMREYLEQNLGRNMREMLKELAENRPSDPASLMGQVFAGKKSPGELKSAPKTTDKDLRVAPPREFLSSTVVPEVAPLLVKLYNSESRRPVSDLGDLLMKK